MFTQTQIPMKIRHFAFLFVGVFLLASCGGSEEKHDHSGDDTALDEVTEQPAESVVNPLADFKFHTMIANLPSPLETFHIIEQVNLYTDEIKLTPTSGVHDLSTAMARAYGYGVFMTDMGFMAYEHQNQKTLDYFNVCRDLSNELGAGEVFDRTITTNFEENTTSQEKFVKMMDHAFNEMDQYMVDNERFVNATEIFLGSWVESQVIAAGILQGRELNDDTRPVYEGIFSQKRHASDLINVLGEIDSEISPDVYEAVEDLMMFYAGFSDVESISQDDLSELENKLSRLKGLLLA